MAQENKELVLRDLCARLQYNCRVFYEYVDDLDGKTYGYSLTLNTWCIDEFIANKAVIKPYLRPMSSMTEEEKRELENFVAASMFASRNKNPLFQLAREALYGDFFNKHHFDYRGLIEKGLALEAPEGMYNLNK